MYESSNQVCDRYRRRLLAGSVDTGGGRNRCRSRRLENRLLRQHQRVLCRRQLRPWSADQTAVTGGLACTGDNSTAVRNGLLPAAFVFSASTRQDNIDISATIGLYPGINSSAAAGRQRPRLPAALQTPGIDARQEFLTFGDASWGTVKMGRDIGLFAKDAILDDMTLLGVGPRAANVAPSNTSLGRIGLGYIYTDWEPQITYTTPNFMGFTGSVGAFQPLDNGDYTRIPRPSGRRNSPMHGATRRAIRSTGKAWVDVVTQQSKAPTNCATVSDFLRAGQQRTRDSQRCARHRGRRRRQDRRRGLRGRPVRILRQGRRYHWPVHPRDLRRRATARIRRRLCAIDVQDRSAEDRRELRHLAAQARERRASLRHRPRHGLLDRHAREQSREQERIGRVRPVLQPHQELDAGGRVHRHAKSKAWNGNEAQENDVTSAPFCSSDSDRTGARDGPRADWSKLAA